ncbi:hypothetical protein [Maribacter aestuarii]|uniref:hypothetical protein n=1 Tax=Maribacter aestuarii TaxID=1130723 RepID=UPI00248BED0F|nr:hypothetical protein [Maribacter aestuarii]
MKVILRYFSYSRPKINTKNGLVHKKKSTLWKKNPKMNGLNLGFNADEDVGQKVFYCHMLLITRRINDVPDPIESIRNVITGKRKYQSQID